MANTTIRNFSSASSANATVVDAILEREALRELDVKFGGESPTLSRMSVHHSAGLAAAAQGDLDGAQRHLSWLAGCLHDLEVKFRDDRGEWIRELYDWVVGELTEEQRELYHAARRAVKYIREVAMATGLHYWPGMLVPGQSLRAMLRAEQLLCRWLECQPWSDKEKGGGWDSAGYYGWNAAVVLSMYRRAGCRLGPRFDRLLRLHHEGVPTSCMKRSFSQEKQLAVARGWRVQYAGVFERHSNQALAVLGRMDRRVAIVAVCRPMRRKALGIAPCAPARARHLDLVAAARATEMWRQIDAGMAPRAVDVLWYAEHITAWEEKYKFLLRALPAMASPAVVKLTDGKEHALCSSDVLLTSVPIAAAVAPANMPEPVYRVHLAYHAGQVWYASYHDYRWVMTQVVTDGWYHHPEDHLWDAMTEQ